MTKADNQTPAQRLAQLIGRACRFSESYSTFGSAIRRNSLTGKAGLDTLEAIAKTLPLALPGGLPDKFKVDFSRGATVVPHVTWVAICPRGRTVSEAMTVTMCFGRRGEGLVAGVMVPTAPSGVSAQLCERTKTGSIKVDVDGPKAATSYNDRFVNPREFLRNDFNVDQLLEHMSASIRLREEL